MGSNQTCCRPPWSLSLSMGLSLQSSSWARHYVHISHSKSRCYRPQSKGSGLRVKLEFERMIAALMIAARYDQMKFIIDLAVHRDSAEFERLIQVTQMKPSHARVFVSTLRSSQCYTN